MTPTEQEVKEAVQEVWDQVAELAATPLGVLLMVEARNAYVGHEE